MLLNLPRTMDPWIAARVYNNHSPLDRLPEELLLLIFLLLRQWHCHYLLPLACLKEISASRLRNRHLEVHNFKRISFFLSESCIRTFLLELESQLRQRLQKDGMCDWCKLWCDFPIERWFRRLNQFSNLDVNRKMGYARGFGCKFKSPLSLGGGSTAMPVEMITMF
ncbi:hypothetical protein F5X99DRAFT_245676 [Biscogniauxia marginata]|nr:hypothetical protein F5X99DRAFT_245676 [Biscogniauxia marginata]